MELESLHKNLIAGEVSNSKIQPYTMLYVATGREIEIKFSVC